MSGFARVSEEPLLSTQGRSARATRVSADFNKLRLGNVSKALSTYGNPVSRLFSCFPRRFRELVSPLNSSRSTVVPTGGKRGREGREERGVHSGSLKPIETISDQCLVILSGNGREKRKSRRLTLLAARKILSVEASTGINLRRMRPPRDRKIKAADSTAACR